MRVRTLLALIVLGLSGLIALAATGGGPDPSVTALGPTVATRGPILGVVPMVDFDEQHEIEIERARFYADVQRQIDEYLAWQHDQDVAAWVAAHQPPPPPPRPAAPSAPAAPAAPRVNGVSNPGGPYADAAECTRAHEGWYTANTGNGYYGAYQFLQSTWNNTVAAMGRPDLVGVRPSDASPADQDAAFWFLWGGGAGAGHWGGRCREYA